MSPDTVWALGNIAVFIFLLLWVASKSINPITQFKWLFGNLGVARGVITVSLGMIALILSTCSMADDYRYEVELGLDHPFSGSNGGCVSTGNQIASNITARAAALMWEQVDMGFGHNHQSCAVNDDKETTDTTGVYTRWRLYDLILIAEAQFDDDGNERYPLTLQYSIIEINQYQLSTFVQAQWGTVDERTGGVAMTWRF